MKTRRDKEPAKIAPGQSPRALIKAVFKAPRMQDKHNALGGLIKSIVDACLDLNEIADYGYTSPWVENALKCKGLGYPSLVQIRRAVEFIAKPIEDEHQRQLAASPFRSVAVGDKIKEDSIYYVVAQGVSLLENIRARALWFDNFIAADTLIQSELKSIYALPNIEAKDAAKSWAKAIGKLTWEGCYWSQPKDLAPGGKLFDAIAKQALRNRQGKRARAFRKRYGISPYGFSKLSNEKKMEIPDKSERSGNEPLDGPKSTRVSRRAVKILNLMPTEAELKLALNEAIAERLKTILRK